jgi:hypothetical protein
MPAGAQQAGTSLTADALRAIPQQGPVEPGFHPYGSINLGYDSNIFRLDSDAPDIGARDDQSVTFAAGINGNAQTGQQRFDLGAEVNHTLYDNHGDLDYTGGNIDAVWHFVAGDVATGDLGYHFDRTLRDFANQNRLDKVIDLRNENSVTGNGVFNLPGPLRLNLRAGFSDITFSQTDTLHVQRSTAGAGLDFVSSSGNLAGIDAGFLHGHYPNNSAADFDQYSVGPTFEWQASPRVKLDGQAAYTKRDNKDVLRKDYDGITAHVDMTVGQGDVTTMTASVYRDLSNLADETAEYAVVNGIRVAPTWTWKEGLIDLRLLAGYENRNFKVTDNSLAREDKVVMAGMFLDWNPRRWFTVTLGVDGEQRSSSRILQDYNFLRVQLGFVARM